MKKRDPYRNCAVDPVSGKKILTRQIAEKDIKKGKPTMFTYIGILLMIGVAIVLGKYVLWAFYLFVVNGLIGIKDSIVTNRKLRNWRQNYVLECPCVEKRVTPLDENPDLLQLWFSKNAEWNVAVPVQQEEFDATQEGDMFYLVCVPDDNPPWAWYNCKDWILDPTGWQ